MLIGIYKNVIERLKLWKGKGRQYPVERPSKSNDFPDLCATSEAEGTEVYQTHLSELLEQRSKVREIAITSPYGGGKSSFIDTYFKINEKYNVTKISLANFVFEDSENKKLSDEDARSLLMANIEKSILQQLLYRLKSVNLPNSRFRKIMNTKLPFSVVTALPLGLLIFALSCSSIFFPTSTLSVGVTAFYLQIGIAHFIKAFSILYIFAFPCLCVKDIYVHLCKYNIKQLNLAKGEVTLDTQNNESVFNIHLEEIIYYFKTSKSDVVVFEDLDRLNNPRIFIKLKEINTILNNCDDITSPVRFIYALKDDIFTGKERTKFFDAIIPIVPITSSANSYAHFKKLLTDTKLILGISESFIRDVAPFIEDMRMHKNIIAEFGIYREKLKAHLSENEYHRLLSFIIYKNVYCQDFALLQENKGALTVIINKRNEMRQSLLNSLQVKIDKLSVKADNISSEKLKSIEELNTLYIFNVLKDIGFSSVGTICKKLPNELVKAEVFEALWNNDTQITYTENNQRYQYEGHNFREYEDTIEGGYSNRVDYIKGKTNSAVASYRAEIDTLTNNRGQLASYSVKQLLKALSKDDIATIINDNNIKDANLLIHLLERGYIDEQYHLYICPFHEGDVTKAEMKYILAAKSNDVSTDEFNLINLSSVYKYFNFEDYSNEAIFHPALINYLIKINDNAHLTIIIKMLEHSDNVNEKDIYKTLPQIENKVKWLQLIVSQWENYSRDIISSTNLSQHEKDTLIFEAINALDLQLITSIAESNDSLETLRLHINEIESIASFIPEEKVVQLMLIRKLTRLKIQFNSIPTGIVQNDLVTDFIDHQLFERSYDNYHYLYYILDMSPAEEQNFTYENLLTVSNGALREIVSLYINDFLESVLFKHNVLLGDNSSGIELLNENDVRFDNKINLIKSYKLHIENIIDITDSNLWPMLIDNQAIACSWENLLACVSKGDAFSANLSDYINIADNTSELVNQSININEDTVDSADLFIELLLSERVSLETFKALAPKFDSHWSNILVGEAKLNKVEILIKLGLLNFSNSDLSEVSENIPELLATFIEYNFAIMLETYVFNEFEYQESDIIYLLKSNQLSSEEKISFCQVIHSAYFAEKSISKKLFEPLTKLYLDSFWCQIPTHILKVIIQCSIGDIPTKVQMISHQINYIELDDLHFYFGALGYPYSRLCKTKSYVKINESKENIALANALADKGYFSISKTKQQGDRIRLNVKGLFKV